MVHQHEACEECTRTCLLIHGRRDPDPSPIVSSFFKVMIDKHFSTVLYFPPKFARVVSHLANEETYLEDSSGQRWKVRICNRSGSLAIRQGWPKFSSEHGLKMGDFLVFHYIQGQHFVVQIFGTSGCQKISFCNETRKRKRRAKTNFEATSQDKLFPEADIKIRKKQKSTPSVTAVPESGWGGHHPVTTTFASNIDADTGEQQRVPQAEGTSDALQDENGPPNHVSTNPISQRESSSVDGVPVGMEILTSETPLHFLDVGTTLTENISEPVNDVSLFSQDENVHTVGLISSTSLKSAENGDEGNHLALLYKKESHCTSNDQVAGEKLNEAFQSVLHHEVKETGVDKRELKETAAKAHCHAKKLNGKESKILDKDGRHSSPAAASGNNKVIESEPADAGDTSFPDGGNFSYLLRVDSLNFLELPQSWPHLMVSKKKQGRIFVKLQGPDNRCWFVMYQERAGFKVLADGWALFTAVYGLKPGDECEFKLLDLSECLFSVYTAQKLDVTQTSLN